MVDSIIIDVREKNEFLDKYIPSSINVPLSTFDCEAPNVLEHFKDKKIIFMCSRGKRAQLACSGLQKLGIELHHAPEVYNGGIMRWIQEGKPIVGQDSKPIIPILRQVQIIAGSIITIFSLLALVFNPLWILGALFIGCGLVFAGISGVCTLAILLSKAPWNNKKILMTNTHKNINLQTNKI